MAKSDPKLDLLEKLRKLLETSRLGRALEKLSGKPMTPFQAFDATVVALFLVFIFSFSVLLLIARGTEFLPTVLNQWVPVTFALGVVSVFFGFILR